VARAVGARLFAAAMAQAGRRTIGCDAVVAQQDNYASAGFRTHHRSVRFRDDAPAAGVHGVRGASAIVPLATVPWRDVLALDRRAFPAAREAFLRAWIAQPGTHCRAAAGPDGRTTGFGVVRPCREGSKVAPVFAEDRATAEALYDALAALAPPGPRFLDVPLEHPRRSRWPRSAG